MKIKWLTVFTCFICASSLFSHFHWTGMNPVAPVVGKTVRINICSGHEFPESAFALKQRLIHKVFVTGPETRDSVAVSPQKKYHSGEYVFRHPGIYKVGFVLKRPQLDAPVYFSNRIVRVGTVTDGNRYPAAEGGFEIAALPGLFDRKKGETAVFKVVRDGQPVQTACEIMVDGRKSRFIKSNSDGELSVPIHRYGEYLIIAGDGGVGTTLTFVLNPDTVGD